MVFGASSLYLVLKVGLTVSASIPVAVISITLFRMLPRSSADRDATILEHNIAQTAGSAGESIAFGVGVTMPAILILGFDLELTRVLLVAVLGGSARHPDDDPAAPRAHREAARRAEVSRGHGLRRSAQGRRLHRIHRPSPPIQGGGGAADGGRQARGTIFTGFGIGLAYKTLMVAFKGWKDTPEHGLRQPPSRAGRWRPRSARSCWAWATSSARDRRGHVRRRRAHLPAADPADQVLRRRPAPPLPPGTKPIREMTPGEIRGAYVLYIGAGAVAASGIISLMRSLPLIWTASARAWPTCARRARRRRPAGSRPSGTCR
jgi:hypothetical protein